MYYHFGDVVPVREVGQLFVLGHQGRDERLLVPAAQSPTQSLVVLKKHH
jgi:hypothetical protein